ncbi:MAG TPA: hypothetical protein VNO30_24600 [Kofleriaceae bacterium]|nr:hypothetical protein [Kofleriaceae bacterium]
MPQRQDSPGEPADAAASLRRREREHGAYLRGLARKLCRSQLSPEELVRGVLERPPRMVPAGVSERAALARALHEIFLEKLHLWPSREDELAETLEFERPPPGAPLWWQALTAEEARAQLARLPEELCAALEPIVRGGASYRELAARLGIAPAVVGERVLRARQQLREPLAPPPAGCEHLARTMACFDGALARAEAEEAQAISHVAGCAACQSLLGDAVGIDALLGGGPRPRARARLVRAAVVAAAAIAAAAALWIGLRPPGSPAPIAAVAAATAAAVAAEAAIVPPAVAAAAESDRAAAALAQGDLERAIRHAYLAVEIDPALAAAQWSLALAAHQLSLPRVARAAAERVAAAGEPGRAGAARELLAVLARELAVEDIAAEIAARGRAMIEGGPPLTAADVAAAPGAVRVDFLDAVRTAPDAARLAALRPLAAALDAHSGTSRASAMLDRADPALGARFGAAYREQLHATPAAAAATQLIDELRAAGPRANDLRVGAMIVSTYLRHADPREYLELQAITAPWKDPWFELYVERDRILATWDAGDLRAQPALLAAVARCTGPAWSMRCGNFLFDLAKALASAGRDDLAEPRAREAAARFLEAGTLSLLARARLLLADIHRRGGQPARARAELEELALASDASEASECDFRRQALIGQAWLAADAGAWTSGRALLPPAEPPAGCTAQYDMLGLIAASDLARRTGDPRDAAVARRWIERARHPVQDGFAITGLARISRGGDPGAAVALDAWLGGPGSSAASQDREAITWAADTAISDAGARGDWARAIELAARERPAAALARCALVVSVDLEEVTVATRVEAALAGHHRRLAPGELGAATRGAVALVPAALAASLAGCDEIAVIARPPLQARAELLPAHLPWWIAGESPGAAPRPGPPRSLAVTDARPPDPSLPPLSAAEGGEPFTVSLAGDAATPSRVQGALSTATYAELHVHAIFSALVPDAAYLALSSDSGPGPGSGGAYALPARALRAQKLLAAPVIVLAAARFAPAAPHLRPRAALPDAFLAAGARAVIAADAPLAGAASRAALADLRRRLERGEPAAEAVAKVRARAPADALWARRLLVFR